MKISVTDETLLQLNENGKTYREIAETFGGTIGQVAGRIWRYKRHLENGAPAPVRELFEVSFSPPLNLKGDWMVVGDVHVPCVDYDFAGLVGRVAEKHGVKKLLVAGDLYNMDLFSSYPKRVGTPTWQREKLAARALLADWANYFDSIVLLMGNHERRLERLREMTLTHVDVFADLREQIGRKVVTSGYGWCTIETPTGIWRATHQRNYSINQLVVADAMASKYQSNIIAHHEHHLAIGWDRYKNYVIVNNGGLFDPAKFEYTVLDDSKSAGMAPGFTMLKNGFPTVYGKEPFTNWEAVLG